VRTTTGRRLRATANHPVLTPTGWKKVGELGPGALVAGAPEHECNIISRRGQANGTAEVDFAAVSGKTLDRPTAIALAERLKAKHIMQMASNDLLWDRVVSIAPAGTAPVYDLVMPRTHNFVANGLIVHNSGEIEQVADLVIFLYREDYYDV